MTAPMKTPGVYLVEKESLSSSAVEVASAIPAFVGHTEKAEIKGKSLLNQPVKLKSIAEYIQLFGGAPQTTFKLSATESNPDLIIANAGYEVSPQEQDYGLFNALRLFFENGGGSCYIVSIGNYGDDYDLDRFQSGLNRLTKEQEPTILAIPEAVKLPFDDCSALQQAMLAHCGDKMKSRVAILDIHEGFLPREIDKDPITNFRTAIGNNFLDYSMAYYPWVHTSVVKDKSLSYRNIHPDSIAALGDVLTSELIAPIDAELEQLKPDDDVEDAARKIALDNLKADYQISIDELISGSDAEGNPLSDVAKSNLNKVLLQLSSGFNQIMGEIKMQLNLLPPSAAMAGVYTMVDNERGVWKAPANVSLNSVVKPAVDISSAEQADLNVSPQGKSINGICAFVGQGTMVWGARTLDGNSLDWRYIQVRRTVIMIEQSIKLASRAYVFEGNTPSTWITMKGMITNFLTGIWKRGGLAGAAPESAFNVSVGLGDTMTPEDVLEGILRIKVQVALLRPAEFIEVTFEQKMQDS